MRFLTPAWCDAMNAAAAAVELDDDVTLTIGQEISGAPDGDVAYCFSVAEGRIHVSWGSAHGADITLVQDYPTAVAVAKGELPAQQAVAEGRLKLRGDVGALVHNGPALAAVAEVFRSVRDRTTW